MQTNLLNVFIQFIIVNINIKLIITNVVPK